MTVAYLDSSSLLAIAFGEPGAVALRRELGTYARLMSSDLIVAECLSVSAREGRDPGSMLALLRPVALVMPPRSLAPEMVEALDEGYLRGADLWHVACAMFLAARSRASIAFLSRDRAQRRIAHRLEFRTP